MPSSSTSTSSLLLDIESIVGSEHVQQENDVYHVHPGSASEISKLVVLCESRSAVLVARGKGRWKSKIQDSRPQLQVDMKRLNHILHLDPTSLLVHVQAGQTGLMLEKALNHQNLTLGDFSPASLISTIGGLLSVRTPGKSTRRHGTLEDSVVGLSAVLAEGRMIHTRVAPRHATGPDLNRVLSGSEGSLGIIVAVHLRVYKLPESRLLAAYSLPSFDNALTAIRLALREEASPAAMQIYDQEEARVRLGYNCPSGHAVLVAATAGPTSLALCDRDLITSAVQVVGGDCCPEKIATTWWQQWNLEKSENDSTSPNLQVSATPIQLIAVYHAVVDACAERQLMVRVHGTSFERDGGVLYFSISNLKGNLLQDQSELLEYIAEEAKNAGAYLLTETKFPLQSCFESLRHSLDPKQIFNPDVFQ